MAHNQQANFCKSVRDLFPQYFCGVFVLDIGSLDVNGNNQFLFAEDCLYLGIDVALGKNVDIVTPGHLLNLPPATFDVIVSTECLEHDRYYIETLRNIVRLLKPGGLFLMSCATTGRPEHGTLRTSPGDAPLLQLVDDEWANYYKNITESDVRTAIDVDHIFSSYKFSIGDETHDLYFYGIKNGTHQKRCDASWLLDSSPRYLKIERLTGELNALQSTNATLRGELDAAQSSIATLRGELDAFLGSKSWRVTHPLRVVMTHAKAIRKLAGRGRNAARYIVRGDFGGLIRRIKSEQKEKAFLRLSGGRLAKSWCVLATPHTLFIANLIAARLESYGLGVDIRTNFPGSFAHDMYVVLCPQMFEKLPPGEKRISFQLEQSVSSRWFTDDYLEVLENSLAVFDYSLKNIEFLERRGIVYPNIFYIPIGAYNGYMPQSLPVIKKYDVLFYGDSASSPRRRKLLDIVRKRFKLRECSEVFGGEMAKEIRAARVVLNIHYYENALLETPRIQECLSLGVPVVSEAAQDQGEYQEIDGAVTFFGQNDVAGMIAALDAALSSSVSRKNIDLAVERSSTRFEFMFDRALVGLGLLPRELTVDQVLPLPEKAANIALSMPETIHRRRIYERNQPSGYVIFDGWRARPGWIGCGLSYASLAKNSLRGGIRKLTVIEDDVLLPEDFEQKMRCVNDYLDLHEGEWDVFAGVVAVLHEHTEIVKHEKFCGMTFVMLNKMTSMVCNIYSERGMRLLAAWDYANLDDQTNTIDKHLERQPGFRVVVALPFLVGHREEAHSTLWGFQNTTYSALIEKSEQELFAMLESGTRETLGK